MARDETEEAEASAKLTLAIIDRQPAVLHLPLTFTLAEASRRLLQQPRIGRPARRLGPSADALRAARSNLAFARPAVSTAKEAGGGGGGAGKGKMGGWCTFGDTIMAAFVKGGGGGGGDISAEVRKMLEFVVGVGVGIGVGVRCWFVVCSNCLFLCTFCSFCVFETAFVELPRAALRRCCAPWSREPTPTSRVVVPNPPPRMGRHDRAI